MSSGEKHKGFSIDHSEIKTKHRHPIHAFEYVDESARLSATGFTEKDKYKIALQLDNMSYWLILDTTTSTWGQMGANSEDISNLQSDLTTLQETLGNIHDLDVTTLNDSINNLEILLDSVEIIVTNVTELEAALAAKRKRIYLKSGPTYNLTKSIAPYSGLSLIGENLPSDDKNTKSDGVHLFYDNDVVIEHYGALSVLLCDISESVRGDDSLSLEGVSLPNIITSGSIITINDYTYLVNKDATNVGDILTLSVRDGVVVDSSAVVNTNCVLIDATNVLRNLTIENISIDDDYDSGSIYLRGCVNVKVNNYSGSYKSDDVFNVRNSLDVYLNDIHTAASKFELIFVSVNNFEIRNIGENLTSNTTDWAANLLYCVNGSVSNSRGNPIKLNYCYNFIITNINSITSHSLIFTNCGYFSIFGCSSSGTLVGFDVYNSSDFVVVGCGADNAETPINLTNATNYQVIGNRWQDRISKVFNGEGVVPTVNNDSIDSAGLGERFHVGDFWVETDSYSVFYCVFDGVESATWIEICNQTTYDNGFSALLTDQTSQDIAIASLETDMTTANASIASLETDMTTANVSITSLEMDMTTANIAINNLDINKADKGIFVELDEDLSALSLVKIIDNLGPKAVNAVLPIPASLPYSGEGNWATTYGDYASDIDNVHSILLVLGWSTNGFSDHELYLTASKVLADGTLEHGPRVLLSLDTNIYTYEEELICIYDPVLDKFIVSSFDSSQQMKLHHVSVDPTTLICTVDAGTYLFSGSAGSSANSLIPAGTNGSDSRYLFATSYSSISAVATGALLISTDGTTFTFGNSEVVLDTGHTSSMYRYGVPTGYYDETSGNMIISNNDYLSAVDGIGVCVIGLDTTGLVITPETSFDFLPATQGSSGGKLYKTPDSDTVFILITSYSSSIRAILYTVNWDNRTVSRGSNDLLISTVGEASFVYDPYREVYVISTQSQVWTAKWLGGDQWSISTPNNTLINRCSEQESALWVEATKTVLLLGGSGLNGEWVHYIPSEDKFLVDDLYGILQEDGTQSEQKFIIGEGGISKGHIGLTPGATYYLQHDGEISEQHSSVQVGIAIDNTSLRVIIDVEDDDIIKLNDSIASSTGLFDAGKSIKLSDTGYIHKSLFGRILSELDQDFQLNNTDTVFCTPTAPIILYSPINPKVGDKFIVEVNGNDIPNNTVTIDFTGSSLRGVNDDTYIFNSNWIRSEFHYNGTTWNIKQ